MEACVEQIGKDITHVTEVVAPHDEDGEGGSDEDGEGGSDEDHDR